MSTTNPRITSEWDDAQRKHGNLPPLEEIVTEETKMFQQIETIEQQQQHLTDQDIDNLQDRGVDFDFEKYRQQRLLELQEKNRLNRFGALVHINHQDFVPHVAQVSRQSIYRDQPSEQFDESIDQNEIQLTQTNSYISTNHVTVVCLLTSQSDPLQPIWEDVLDQVARSRPYLKLCLGSAQKIIPNYPHNKCPVLLIYNQGHCKVQIAGLKDFGFSRPTIENFLSLVERLLLAASPTQKPDQND